MKHCDSISYNLFNKFIKALIKEIKIIGVDIEYLEEIADNHDYTEVKCEACNIYNHLYMVLHILEELNKDEDD